MKKILGTIAIALLLSASERTASAALTFTSTVDGNALAGQNYASFDAIPLGTAGGTSNGVGVSFTAGGAAVQGSLTNIYAAPVLSGTNNLFFGTTYSGSDTTTYLTTGIGSVTLSFASPETYFGILWGSVDAFNTLTFLNGTTVVGVLTGANVIAVPNGNQSASGTTYVNVNSSLAFTSVVATSTSNAFEFDNVAYGTTAVPEPSSIALCGIAGVFGLVASRVRRKRTA